MRKLLRASLALAALAGCDGDSSSTQTSPKPSSSTVQPLTLTTSSAGLAEQQMPTSVMVQLHGHFEQAVVARRNADGTISTECHDELQSAEAFMQGGATSSHPGVK